jgi:Ca2+-binding EF-hand superfamily protein
MSGKTLLNALRAIPGLNVAAAVLNAAVSGSITLSAGEISNILFQKVYNNEIELKSVNWNKEITKMFNDYLPHIVEALKKLDSDNNGKVSLKDIGEALAAIAKSFTKKK